MAAKPGERSSTRWSCNSFAGPSHPIRRVRNVHGWSGGWRRRRDRSRRGRGGRRRPDETGLARDADEPADPALRRLGDRRPAREHGALVGVDNAILSPYFQRPLDLGADLVAHSTTTYLNGHSDSIGGAVVTDGAALAEELELTQGITAGGVLAFELAGTQDDAIAVLESLEEFTLAVSLGGVESLVELPAAMTHEPLDRPSARPSELPTRSSGCSSALRPSTAFEPIWNAGSSAFQRSSRSRAGTIEIARSRANRKIQGWKASRAPVGTAVRERYASDRPVRSMFIRQPIAVTDTVES